MRKKITLNYTAGFLSAIIFSASVHAQTLDSVMEKYSSKFQPEKAYLHYDKSSYSPGETIWFKAYLMEGLFPAAESKTLYVDWIADNGTVLEHSVSPLVAAVTNGQFEVPENYTGNLIHVRAYTKWMLNFDTAFLYNREIRILNNKNNGKGAKATIIPSIQFFPEGGDMVEGVNSRVAFKANDQYGRPVTVKGVVQDSKGAVIDSIRVVHDGMGSFNLIPQVGMNYTAKWKDEKGNSYTTALPASKTGGVTLQVSMKGTKRVITIFSGSELEDRFKQMHLIGTLNSKIAFKTDVPVAPAGTVSRILPSENLPSGIITITLFDASWNAIAERICFIKNNDYSFQPSMEVKYWGLGRRKRNEIEISVPDSLGMTSMSVSVTDAAIEKDTSENIISHFLLTSEIKGRVYNPSYYFSDNSEKTARDLDLVMLTHGWRRFLWEDLAKGKLPAITYPRDTGYLTLSGRVFGVAKSQLSGKESIVLLVKGKDAATKMLIVPIERDASFSDPETVLFDSVRIYYSLKSKFLSQAEARFMTDRLPAPNYLAFSKNFITSNPFVDTTGLNRHLNYAAEAARLAALDRGKIMENITVTAKQKPTVEVLDKKYASGLFQGDAYQFDLVNDPLAVSALNIFNYLQGKVAGLQISNSGGTPSLSWRGGSPALYIDEIASDADMLGNIPVTDVAYIKVFRPPFMGGFGGANGAIAVYTKRGDDTKSSSGGLASNTVVGYSPIKEFYSPNYERYDPRNENKDVRTTIYWNPQVNTSGQNQKVLLKFFNNDVSNSFRVVIEGMTKDGLLTHYEQIME
jgi:hypothetical protein